MFWRRALYERFFDGFAAAGEPNIPIDRQLMAAPAFYALLSRLRQHAEEHQRDHWFAFLLMHCASSKWENRRYLRPYCE